MRSLILRTMAPWLSFLILVVSVFILWQGHNTPGGGFIGGLTASLGLIFYSLAYGYREMERRLKVRWTAVMALGLGIAGVSIVFSRKWISLFDQMWGTPQLFDVGVYFVVIGMATLLMSLVMED